MEKQQLLLDQSEVSTKQNQPAQEEEQLMDFSAMFKKNANVSRPKLGQKPLKPQGPNWLLQIPAKLLLTKQDLCCRKVLDMRRWMSIVKGTHSQQLISSVISAWNYLYSTTGLGKQNMLNLSQFNKICNVAELNNLSQLNTNESKIKFVSSLFDIICKNYATPSVNHRVITLTEGQQSEQQQNGVLAGLKSNKSYIYFAYGRILCPIGYDITPLVPLDAYKKLQDIPKTNQELWIINSQCNCEQRSFMIKRWKDIELQLKSQWPQFLDLDQTKKGKQKQTELSQDQTVLKRQKSFMIQFYL